jgi:4-amino-4-deoxy-L-arabinose transferase-like glycosyltransferase
MGGSERSSHHVDPSARLIAALAAVGLVAAIYLGSRGLANSDSALIAYAAAIVFLTFGVVSGATSLIVSSACSPRFPTSPF